MGPAFALSCPSVGGKADCSSWTFESGGTNPLYPTEGWMLGNNNIGQPGNNASTGALSISSAQKNSGTFSLSAGFNGTGVILDPGTGADSGRDLMVLKVKLCAGGQSLDLSAKNILARMRFVPPPLTANSDIFLMLFTDSGLTAYTGGLDFSIDPVTGGGLTTAWYPFQHTGVSFTGPVTGIGFFIYVGDPYVGTVYIDDVQIF
jgi:hypothetical protein